MFHCCRQFILNDLLVEISTSWRRYALVLEIMNIRAEICPDSFFQGHKSKSFFCLFVGLHAHQLFTFLLALLSQYTEYLNVLEFTSVLISPHYDIHISSNPPFEKTLFSCLQLTTLSTVLSVGMHIPDTYLCSELPLLPKEESLLKESNDCQALLLLTFHDFTAMVPAVGHTSVLLLT